jgi:hypothetical protein
MGGVGMISPDGSRLVIPGENVLDTGGDGAHEFVFTAPRQGLAGTSLKGIAATVTVQVVIAGLGWFITRRLASRRRAAQSSPQRSEDRATFDTSPPTAR